jgi:hypothetical protein
MTNLFSLTHLQLLISHPFICHLTHFLSFAYPSLIHMLTQVSVSTILFSHNLLLVCGLCALPSLYSLFI